MEEINLLVDLLAIHNLDYIQIGFLNINLATTASIKVRNLYSFFTRRVFARRVFELFGFKEVG
jgi:hypothetical protein